MQAIVSLISVTALSAMLLAAGCTSAPIHDTITPADPSPSHPVTVLMVPDRATVAPGETFQLIVSIRVAGGYISRFTEDQPIAVTPSVFAGPVACSRATILRRLRNPEFQFAWFKNAFQPDLWAKLDSMGREKASLWADQNSKFLHPDPNQQLEIDQDLVAINIPFDDPEFFSKTIADLRAGGSAAERTLRLLHRYVPGGPGQSTADAWATWWNTERAYLFASDAGEYRWYIDSLAQKRHIPSADLRGPKRADTPSTIAAK